MRRTEVPEIRPARDARDRAEALRVRVAVFVDEQGGPLADEPDDWDGSARQFVLEADGGVVGTARLLVPDAAVGKIGRVALLPEYRGRGWGRMLMEEVLRAAGALGLREVRLDAQTGARPFYERLGFRAVGEEFVEAGLPHQTMRLPLHSPAADLPDRKPAA
jgi:predicted GNAT family N-acyltransferase